MQSRIDSSRAELLCKSSWPRAKPIPTGLKITEALRLQNFTLEDSPLDVEWRSVFSIGETFSRVEKLLRSMFRTRYCWQASESVKNSIGPENKLGATRNSSQEPSPQMPDSLISVGRIKLAKASPVHPGPLTRPSLRTFSKL